MASLRIDAGEHSIGYLSLDLQSAPEFVGGLSIDLHGLSNDGVKLFSMAIVADVRSRSVFEGLALEPVATGAAAPEPVAMPPVPKRDSAAMLPRGS